MNERPVQRYFLNMYVHYADVMQPAATNPSLTEPSGDWVLYAEHVAALRACEQRVLNAAVQRVEEMAIPHAFPVTVTCDVWNQVIGECIAAIKGDSDD